MGDPIRGRAKQVVAEEMATMPDHDQVVCVGLGVVRDHLGGVTGDEVGLDCDSSLLRLAGGLVEDAFEELVLFVLDLLDLPDGRGVRGKLSLDGQRCEFG
jgi:hypothetical protein